jgi:ABC-type polysaccharide/polyol phosphate export permease
MPQQQPLDEQVPIRVISPGVEPGHATAGLGVFWSHRSLLWDFVQFDLKQRYTGGSLGFFLDGGDPFIGIDHLYVCLSRFARDSI